MVIAEGVKLRLLLLPSFPMSDSAMMQSLPFGFRVCVGEGKDAGKSPVKPIIFIARQ